jgi:hypothetical protein
MSASEDRLGSSLPEGELGVSSTVVDKLFAEVERAKQHVRDVLAAEPHLDPGSLIERVARARGFSQSVVREAIWQLLEQGAVKRTPEGQLVVVESA